MKIAAHFFKKIKSILWTKKSPPFEIKSNNIIQANKFSYHNGNFDVRGDQKVSIGSYCAFGKNISIITSNHDYNFACIQGSFYKKYFSLDHPGVTLNPPNEARTKGNVRIGNDVWIADNVTILSGVTIGNGACIGNNSIVTKNIEPYSISAGIPAKEIKKRFHPEKIVFLEELKWWTWSKERIQLNKDFFNCDINKTDLTQIKKIIR